ncbi:type II secretion system F family protein [bacterium]|nr:type II secretion system F family protein [bacterium]
MRELDRFKALKIQGLTAAQKTEKQQSQKKTTKDAKRGSYSERLLQAGIYLPSSVYIVGIMLVAIFFGILMGRYIGPLAGLIFIPACLYYFLDVYLVARAEKRRRDAVMQLPGFVDALSASLQTGYNMEKAIDHATVALPQGVFKRELRRVTELLDKGVALDDALIVISNRITGQEIVSLLVTIRLFSDMGGRVLEPFRRLGFKIREQQAVLERAQRDLVGTKQAFFVIFGLSIIVPISLLSTQPDYLQQAFADPRIGLVMQLAIVIQLVCFLLFKHFTTLKV